MEKSKEVLAAARDSMKEGTRGAGENGVEQTERLRDDCDGNAYRERETIWTSTVWCDDLNETGAEFRAVEGEAASGAEKSWQGSKCP